VRDPVEDRVAVALPPLKADLHTYPETRGTCRLLTDTEFRSVVLDFIGRADRAH
jgi:hypothetical protein